MRLLAILPRTPLAVVLTAGLLWALSMPAAQSQAPQVVAGHPRIYLRPAALPALRARVTQAPVSTYYNQLRSRMDGTSARHTNNEVAGFELESLALLHAMRAARRIATRS